MIDTDTAAIATTPAASSTAGLCYDQLMKLAFLNQQSDGGAIELRRGKKCLTLDGQWLCFSIYIIKANMRTYLSAHPDPMVTELNAIANQEVQRNHPLNCANINAKPYPYYDAGLMKVG